MPFKARFHRREDGGYDAEFGKQSKKLTAVVKQETDRSWFVAEGFGVGEIEGSKALGTVKERWGKAAEAVYGTEEAGPAVAPAPGSGSTPPRVGPPRVGPPSLKPKPAGPPPLRKGPPSLAVTQGKLPAHQEIIGETPEGGKVYGPTTFDQAMAEMDGPHIPKAEPGDGGCVKCGRPVSGWRKEADGCYRPPCRCGMPNEADYEPDPLDPRMYEVDPSTQMRSITPVGVLDKVFYWMLRNKEYVTTEGQIDAPWNEIVEVLARTTGYAEYRKEQFNETE